MPVAVTVSTLMAVTLFMDSASARPAGRVSTLGHSGPRPPLALGGASNRKWVQKNPYGGGLGQVTLPLSPTGTRCHLPCPEGFWGANCSNACTCKNGGTCIPETGNCVCAPGFRGPSCQRCEAPSLPPSRDPRPLRLPALLALHCQMPQSPLYPAWSLPLIPMCPQLRSGEEGGPSWDQGLVEGWPRPQSPAASPPACQPGRYGKRCVPCKCENHSSCHPSDGTCYCLAGWTGRDCSQRTCVVA